MAKSSNVLDTPGRYDFDENTSVDLIKSRLVETRATSNIYRTGRVIQVLRYRGVKIGLTPDERLRLADAIRKARFSEHLPLAKWLPRGYQIARLLALAKDLMPSYNWQPTRRDVEHMLAAAKHIKKDKSFGDDQLPSLIQTAQLLDVKIAA